MRINEIPTGKLRVIHVIMVSQSRFTVHGQVHVIGTNLVSSEIGMGESGRFTMPTPALSSILPSPCFSGVLAEEVEEETWPEEGSTEIIAGVELERNSQHGPAPPSPDLAPFHKFPQLALPLYLPTVVLLLENSLRDSMEGESRVLMACPIPWAFQDVAWCCLSA